jgi:UDP-GlcNAc3NAcA epimerase
MLKVFTVLGARPQFIKASAVSKAIRTTNSLYEKLIHTGQHFDPLMSEVFFSELDLQVPDFFLGVSGGGHGEMTGQMLIELERLMIKERPDIVMVYGDTNSTLAGALAASKLHIPVVHIEAGLRSFNKSMPEEQNRILTDHLSDLLFTPNQIAVNNLASEGIVGNKVINVGDVMLDVANFSKERSGDFHLTLSKYGLIPKEYVLCTLHRAENVDSPSVLKKLVTSMENIAKSIRVILPIHPRTKLRMSQFGLEFKEVMTIPPLGYFDMGLMLLNAALVATDSGGVQKEAFFYEIPCVTLRSETEWSELVDNGWNIIVCPKSASVDEIVDRTISRIGVLGRKVSLYGDGFSSRKIVDVLQERYKSI